MNNMYLHFIYELSQHFYYDAYFLKNNKLHLELM